MATEVIAGKYRIVREIARSNDVVYEAVDTTMGRRVAVKELVVPPNLTGAPRRERIERFHREARAAGKLTHPNIVTIYDYGEDNGRYYIAMEFLEGGTLRDRLQTIGALAVHEALDIARQVLSALAHAHAHKVIHRDVKPDNIHILPDGQIKLTDFGIARLTEEASLTGDGQVFGTPSYMSPEQIEGRFIDHRSDLFSTAVVLYEMLSGRKPFTGDSVVTITYAIMNAEPPPLVGVPFTIEQVVRQGLAKDPARRFQSAEAMRQALVEAASTASSPTSTGQQPPSLFLPPPVPGPPYHQQRAPSPWQAAHPPPDPFARSYPPAVTPALPPPVAALPPVYPQQPAQMATQPGQGGTVVGPFASWGSPAAAQGQVGHAPVPQYRGAGDWSVPENVRAFVKVLVISFVLAGLILGGVVLFLRSWEAHQRTGETLAIQAQLRTANALAQSGDLEGAARAYEQVLLRAPDSVEGIVARTSLAEAMNRLGVRAAQFGEYGRAAQWFARVLELYERYPNGMTQQDLSTQQVARENLDALRMRPGDAVLPEGSSAGEEPPASTTPDSFMEQFSEREAQAEAYLEQGDAAYREGQLASARQLWNEAAKTAPGSKAALTAQERLAQHSVPPPF